MRSSRMMTFSTNRSRRKIWTSTEIRAKLPILAWNLDLKTRSWVRPILFNQISMSRSEAEIEEMRVGTRIDQARGIINLKIKRTERRERGASMVVNPQNQSLNHVSLTTLASPRLTKTLIWTMEMISKNLSRKSTTTKTSLTNLFPKRRRNTLRNSST